MSGFDDRDAVGQQSVLITRDDQAVEGRRGGPVLLDGKRHRCGGLAGTDDQRASFGRRGQVSGNDAQRVGSGQRRGKAALQQFARAFRIHGSTAFR